ncbi:MAG: DUF3375 domain-containing protein, partial [Acidimicrobiia bacterium]|nr:DUF3375 domain-containing protein [Acidimicrobiia bacterium]
MDGNERGIRSIAETYDRLRHQHPAWRLLTARRAPLVLGCLRILFDGQVDRVTVDD